MPKSTHCPVRLCTCPRVAAFRTNVLPWSRECREGRRGGQAAKPGPCNHVVSTVQLLTTGLSPVVQALLAYVTLLKVISSRLTPGLVDLVLLPSDCGAGTCCPLYLEAISYIDHECAADSSHFPVHARHRATLMPAAEVPDCACRWLCLAESHGVPSHGAP